MKVGTLIHPAWLAKALLNPSTGNILLPLVEKCVREGARHIEITGEIFTLATPDLLDLLDREIREVLSRYKEENGITFSLHLPAMGGLDVSSSVEDIRKTTINTFRELERITRPLEPESYVLHVAGMILEAANSVVTGNATSNLRKLLINNALHCVKEITDFLDPKRVCIENLPYYSMDFLDRFVDELDLSVCLDIGHLTLRGETLEDFLRKFKVRVREVHLHDVKNVRYGPNVLTQVDHHALGDGNLDMERIIHTLHTFGFSGALVLETLHDKEMNSIRILNDLLHSRGQNQK